MAKRADSLTFTNATIDIGDDTITEYAKDDTTVSSLSSVLKELDKEEGLTIIFKRQQICAIGEAG